MFDKLPVFANKIYNKSSDHQDLYEFYKSSTDRGIPIFVEDELFRMINIIYTDFVENGFGSDWSNEYNLLISDLENIPEISYLTSYLEDWKKYSRGYKIDDNDIMQVCEDLELVICKILDYIDSKKVWTKIKTKIEY